MPATADYAPATSAPLTFTVAKAETVCRGARRGGIYSGSPFPAIARVGGVVVGDNSAPASELEGTVPTLTYYAGATPAAAVYPARPARWASTLVVAFFAGSADYAAAQSGPLTYTIAAVSKIPTVSIAASSNWGILGQPLTLTVTVTPAPNNTNTPGGTVTLVDATTNTSLGTVGVSGGTPC